MIKINGGYKMAIIGEVYELTSTGLNKVSYNI